MIQISQLHKRHGARTVLDDVSFTARPGRVTGFVGPNGAGKSSTLRILIGLDRATSGTALIDGRPYRALAQPLRTVGSMLDGALPLPERRGIDHLRWIAQSNRIGSGRVHEVLHEVGLTHAARARVRTYSLGMRQRLCLAAALLGDPEVLVLDEPANGLDPDGIRTLRTFLRACAHEGRTVLLSSHLMAETQATVDDVVIIARGRILRTGALADVVGGHPSLEAAVLSLTGDPVGGSWRS